MSGQRMGSYNAGGASNMGMRGMTAEQKRTRTCQSWNESSCTKPGKDSLHCGYGQAALRHGCAKILSKTQICWGNHRECDHK